MKLKFLALITVFLMLSDCNDKKDSKDKSEDTIGTFSAIFLDVNSTQIAPPIDPNMARETKKFSNINLTNADQFWGGKKMFFMHGLGGIDIKEAGEYFFRLTSTGKVKMQLNNVDLIVDNNLHDKSMKDGRRVLPKEIAVFDFEYYVGEYSPYLVLEWSRDGENFEIVPDQFFVGTKQLKPKPIIGVESNNETQNILTEQEKADGWKLLFDGKSLNGWHTYNDPGKIGSKWQAIDGTLTMVGYGDYFLTYFIDGTRFYFSGLNADKKRKLGGIDIVTDESFENFELSLEWKISKDGNSGLFYTVQEIPEYVDGWNSSPEMQIMDNQGHKDGLIYRHRTGDLYDLISSKKPMAREAGMWNQIRIIKNKGKVEHW